MLSCQPSAGSRSCDSKSPAGTSISPPLRQLVDRRLAKLERLLNDSAVSAQVVLSKERHRHQAEIIVHARGDHMLRGRRRRHGLGGRGQRGGREDVEQQAEKLKGKWKSASAERRPPRVRAARASCASPTASRRRRRPAAPSSREAVRGHADRRRAQDALRGEADGPRRRRRALPRPPTEPFLRLLAGRDRRLALLFERPDGRSGSSSRRASRRRAARTSAWPTRLPGVTVDAARARHRSPPALDARAAGRARRPRPPSPARYTQKTGLALAGFDEYLQAGRVLVFGESEVRFLEAPRRRHAAGAVAPSFSRGSRASLITGGSTPPDWPDRGRPTAQRAAAAHARCRRRSRYRQADRAARRPAGRRAGSCHGVLMDILGLGVLSSARAASARASARSTWSSAAIAWSPTTSVEVRRRGESILIGTCPELTRHHMEIRGLGLINVQDLFGVASTRTSKRVELVVQLERWEPRREYDRLGLDDDVLRAARRARSPLIRMPVAPGRNLAILVEVAARNQLLRARGHHAARRLAGAPRSALALDRRRRGSGRAA